MSRILLLIENEANRALLSEWEWLSRNHEILIAEPGGEIGREFDLCIADLPSMEAFYDQLRTRAAEAEEARTFTPHLLVTSRDPSTFSGSPVWEFVDEVITTPIRKRELRGRIGVLLRTRELTTELKESEERFRTLFQAGPDPAFVLDAEGRIEDANDAFCDLVGMAYDELIGGSFPELECFSEETTRTLVERFEADTNDGTTSPYTVEIGVDGARIAEVNSSRIGLADGDGQLGIIRDVTERKQREDELAALNEMAQEFTRARTPEEVCDVVVEASVSALNLPVTVIALYDGDAGVLRPVARTERAAEAGDEILFDRDADLAWRAYVGNEPYVFDDLHETPGFEETALRSAVILPLGKHGVLVTGSLTPNAFDDADLDFAELLAATTEATLDRAEREELLHERERTLQEQNEKLTRLNRLNDVIRDVDQALVGASTREEIERAVCERLVESEPYVFAWIGEYDAANKRVEPRQWAGAGGGYLDEVTFRSGADVSGPVGRALKRGRTEVIEDMHGTPPFDAWREAALKRGYRSSITIPLVYANSLYGVLTLYADEPGVFTGREREIMEELGNTIAYAINAVESKRALLSDSVVELEFVIRDSDFFLSRLARETGSEVSLKGYFPQSEDGSILFFTVTGTSPEAVLDFADRSVSVEEANLIGESDGETLFEFRMDDGTIASMLADHGAVPRTVTSHGDATNVVTELPHGSDIRTFVEMFQRQFPDAELLARRERERPLRTRQAFRSQLLDRLTDRQREVLRAAYFSGFFEWPRGNSGTEIAEALDISQPTFHNHLRASERKLFEMLLDDE